MSSVKLVDAIVDRLVTEGPDFDFHTFLGDIPKTLVDRLQMEQHLRKCRFYQAHGVWCVGREDKEDKLLVCRECVTKRGFVRGPLKIPHLAVLLAIRSRLYVGQNIAIMFKSTNPETALQRWQCAVCCKSLVELWDPRPPLSASSLPARKRIDFHCCDKRPEDCKFHFFVFSTFCLNIYTRNNNSNHFLFFADFDKHWLGGVCQPKKPRLPRAEFPTDFPFV